jgi:hypothetical protein
LQDLCDRDRTYYIVSHVIKIFGHLLSDAFLFAAIVYMDEAVVGFGHDFNDATVCSAARVEDAVFEEVGEVEALADIGGCNVGEVSHGGCF